LAVSAWLAVGTTALVVAVLVVLARFLVGPVRRAHRALTRRRRAELRAEALLLGWLLPGQRSQYRSRGWFDVVTPAGSRYRVCPRKVVRLDGRRSAYCIEATPWVPEADQMLAKKLLLETDERRFLATAYRYR
jgi:hypothetical protein